MCPVWLLVLHRASKRNSQKEQYGSQDDCSPCTTILFLRNLLHAWKSCDLLLTQDACQDVLPCAFLRLLPVSHVPCSSCARTGATPRPAGCTQRQQLHAHLSAFLLERLASTPLLLLEACLPKVSFQSAPLRSPACAFKPYHAA